MGYNPEFMNRSRKRASPEAHLLLTIIKWLNIEGWYVGKVKTKGSFTKQGAFILDRYQMIGLPDALAFKNGIMLAIETKVGSNKLTPAKEEFKKHFHKPPDRLFIETRSLEDVTSAIK